MKTRIHSNDLIELSIEADYPAGFRSTEDPVTERVYRSDNSFGQGFYREMFFEGVHIGHGSMDLAQNTFIEFESDLETVEMHFALSGGSFAQAENAACDFAFTTNQHNLIYAHGFRGNAEWAGNQQMQVFEVNLLPSFFARYLPEHPFTDAFRKRIDQKETAIMARQNRPITAQMRGIIFQMIHCQREGIFKKLYLEAQVLELLLLQLEQLMETPQLENGVPMKKQDIEKLYAVRDILHTHLHQNISLPELAKKVGTNVFQLKKGFKCLFGDTVFGYWHVHKMDHARQVLLDGATSVADVAEQVGYKNPQHFSTAFKKRYGIPPGALKSS